MCQGESLVCSRGIRGARDQAGRKAQRDAARIVAEDANGIPRLGVQMVERSIRSGDRLTARADVNDMGAGRGITNRRGIVRVPAIVSGCVLFYTTVTAGKHRANQRD